MAGQQIHLAAGDIQQLTGRVRAGRGNLGYLLHDTTLATDLHVAMGSFKRVGSRADTLVQSLSTFTSSLSNQTGTLNTVLHDTAFSGNLSRTMGNVEQGTARFSEDMKALQSNFLFRGYFRRKGTL